MRNQNNKKIECWVPKGSSLGPLLFTLYINDLPLASEYSATFYANDTCLALSDKSLTQLKVNVNNQLLSASVLGCKK